LVLVSLAVAPDDTGLGYGIEYKKLLLVETWSQASGRSFEGRTCRK